MKWFKSFRRLPFASQALLLFGLFFVLGGSIYEAHLINNLPEEQAHSHTVGLGGEVQTQLKDYGEVPLFHLTDQHGKPFSQNNLLRRVSIVDFVYSRCTGPCPILTSRMHRLEQALPSSVQFISISVDPSYDTPSILKAYAKKFRAGKKWVFLTGKLDEVKSLILQGFRLASWAEENPKMKEMKMLPVIYHTARFVLLDRQAHIRGYYPGTDLAAIKELKKDALSLTHL